MPNFLQKAWGYLQGANDYWDEKTQPVHGRAIEDKLENLTNYFKFDTDQISELDTVRNEEDGPEFINRKINDVNRNASHRTAFATNALFQFLLVNLSSISILSFVPDSWFKVLLVGANLVIAFLAWRRIRTSRSQILKGPSEEPEWSFWGMFRSNRRKHNQHIKDLAEPHKIRMRDIIRGLINFPLFIVTIPLAIANAYWAFRSNNQVVKAATERGSMLDKLKL